MKQEGIPAKGARAAASDRWVTLWYLRSVYQSVRSFASCCFLKICHVSCQYDCQSNMSVCESCASISMVVFQKKKKNGENNKEISCFKFNANAEPVSLLYRCFT